MKGKPKENNQHGLGLGNGVRSTRKQRQEAALQRAEARAARSQAEQLTRLDAGGFAAKRERARLYK